MMEDFDEDRGLAPKIFFVAPDPSVVSDSFLETAFLLGYETYMINNEQGIDLKERVELLVDTFDELLLFFTIERDGSEEDWANYLGSLQDRNRERVRVGVLIGRTLSSQDEARTRSLFLLDAGLSGGCVSLHSAARRNQQLLLDVLAANQAGGRRKRIRMRCHAPYGVNFVTDRGFLDAALIDLSVSHFSASFEVADPDWGLGTRVSRVQLRLGGHLLMVNVLVGLKRMSGGKAVYVFLFHPETERPGLEDLVSARINVIIYRQFQARTEAMLEERYRMMV